MNITLEKIRSLNACEDGVAWYAQHGSPDLLKTLLDINELHPDWARWLFTRLMGPKQRIMIAVYSAELVLHIFEDKFPNDKRPRNAIEAARKALKSNTEANRNAAAAAYAAYAAATADAAAATAAYAYADARKDPQVKIIREAVRLLGESC